MSDLETLMANIEMPEIKYVAVFDPDTGEVTSVGPSYAFPEEKFTLDLDDETALSIIEGRTKIHACFVDPTSNTLELTGRRTELKMDDVLHRIVDSRWSNIEKPDLHITYDNNTIVFQLTEELYGTYILDKKFQPVKKREVRWDRDMQLHFFITEYNDPNILYQSVVVTLADIIAKSHTVDVTNLPVKFSIYTRRVFKNYVIEKL